MVQLKCFAVVICLLSQSAAVDLVNEESKNIVLKSKKSHKLGPNNHFHCDLSLLPQQKKMMYYGLREQQTERSFDIYKWPKNKEGLVIVPYWISRNSQYSEWNNL